MHVKLVENFHSRSHLTALHSYNTLVSASSNSMGSAYAVMRFLYWRGRGHWPRTIGAERLATDVRHST